MKALIEQIRNGDKQAFETLYLQQRPIFVNWMKKKFGVSKEGALDVYQETMLVLYENILNDKITYFSSKINTYLFTLGRNIWLKKQRKESRETSFVLLDKQGETGSLAFENVVAEEDSQQSSELEEVFLSLIEEMKDPCYSILKYTLLFGMSGKEIAKQLDYKDVNVLYIQKNRCLKKVKASIKLKYKKEDF